MTDTNPSTSEIWKPIPTWERRYEASSDGRIRAIFSHRHGAYYVLKPCMTWRGYLRVQLSDKSRRQWFSVHSIIALTFIGPRPEGKHINHKNGNKTENQPDNLEYVTPRENQIHAGSIGLLGSGDKHWTRRLNHTLPRGERRPNAKLKDADIGVIRTLKKDGVPSKVIASRFNISVGVVNGIIKGTIWTHA